MKSPPRAYTMTARARTTAETADRILDGMVELFVDVPYAQITLAAVAERAGVTVQTVLRRFGDKEGLARAATSRAMASIGSQRDAAPVGDVVAAVDNLVEHYATAGATALRLLAEEHSTPSLSAAAQQGRAYHRGWCARVFAPYLTGLTPAGRQRRLAQLVAVCDVYTWKLLHVDAGLSRRQLTMALLELVEPLTTTAEPAASHVPPPALPKGH